MTARKSVVAADETRLLRQPTLGTELADELLAKGAKKILDRLYAEQDNS